MKILAIDTTTRFLCIGIYDNSKLYEYTLELGRKQSFLIVPTVRRVLEAIHRKLPDIDYFACGLGPGSFTGVRVGMSTIKGFAWALNKPILGISTLDILAKNAKDSDGAYIMPIIDAKRDLIYCSVFRKKNEGMTRIMPYMLLTEKEFFRHAKPNSVILGDAVSAYKEKILRNIKGATVLDQDYWYPQARNIIALGLEKLKDKKFDNPFDIKPIYLYPKECQICDTTGQPGQRLI